MRLLQIIAGAEFGGFETFFTRLAAELQRRPGIEQRVATRPWPERLAALQAIGAEVLPLKLGGTMDLVSRWRLARDAAAWKPDVVLAWANRATAMAPRTSAPLCARIGHYYKLKNYRRTDFIIAITGGIRDFVVQGGYPPERVATIPNFHRRRGLPPASRADLATPEGVPVVFAGGRLHKAKGFDVLLRSLVGLDGTVLWLAGTGPEDAALKSLAGDLGIADRVRFLGWRNDIEALMGAADAVAMPSRSEGLGTVILEAWATGTPLVAAASEGPSELVTDGRTGRLVPVDDAGALTAALRDVIADPAGAASLAANATALYESRFTAERVAELYRNALEGFVRVGPRPSRRPLSLVTPVTEAVRVREAMAPAGRVKLNH